MRQVEVFQFSHGQSNPTYLVKACLQCRLCRMHLHCAPVPVPPRHAAKRLPAAGDPSPRPPRVAAGRRHCIRAAKKAAGPHPGVGACSGARVSSAGRPAANARARAPRGEPPARAAASPTCLPHGGWLSAGARRSSLDGCVCPIACQQPHQPAPAPPYRWHSARMPRCWARRFT